MALIERIMEIEPSTANLPKPNVHALPAMLAEFRRGNVTAAQVITAFRLRPEDQAEALAIKNRLADLVNPLLPKELDDLFLLMESRLPPCDTPANARARLGV